MWGDEKVVDLQVMADAGHWLAVVQQIARGEGEGEGRWREPVSSNDDLLIIVTA